jgi:hypothetical protein
MKHAMHMRHRERNLSMPPPPLKRRLRSEKRRGAAVAELAVCLPLLVLLVVATMEACTMVYLKKSLTVAAYEAGRTSLMPGASSADVTAQCQQVLNDRGVQGGTSLLNPLVFETAPEGTYLQVSVTAPCESNTMLGTWFYAGRSLTAKAAFKKEF